MKFAIIYSAKTREQLRKLDKSISMLILNWISKNLDRTDNPRQKGKTLSSDKKTFWRYRIGDYRVVADIKDHELVIIIISAAHRREIY